MPPTTQIAMKKNAQLAGRKIEQASTNRRGFDEIAVVTAPERVSAQHQSLLHFISQGG